MRTWMAGALAVSLLVSPGIATAKDHPEDPLGDLIAEAKECAKAGQEPKAARVFGDAIALSQKMGDLLAEQEACDAFLGFLGTIHPIEPSTVGGIPAYGFGVPDVMAEVLGRIDPKRCGAFVSAPCLAGDLLLFAVQKGEDRFVPVAAAALAANVKSGKQGAGIAFLAKFAVALRPQQPGSSTKAMYDDIEQMMDSALREGWTDLALATGLEWAARAAARADGAEDAKGAIRRLVALVTRMTDPRLLSWLREGAEARLKGAAGALVNQLTDALDANGRGGAGAGGERDGNGADAGSTGSPLAEAIRNAPKGSPLGTVTRTTEGLELRVPWDPKFRGVHRHQDGVKHLDDGGLTVSCLGWSVAMRMADPAGTRGQPVESGRPEPARAFYRLAKGETWTLRSDGIVVVSAGR